MSEHEHIDRDPRMGPVRGAVASLKSVPQEAELEIARTVIEHLQRAKAPTFPMDAGHFKAAEEAIAALEEYRGAPVSVELTVTWHGAPVARTEVPWRPEPSPAFPADAPVGTVAMLGTGERVEVRPAEVTDAEAAAVALHFTRLDGHKDAIASHFERQARAEIMWWRAIKAAGLS